MNRCEREYTGIEEVSLFRLVFVYTFRDELINFLMIEIIVLRSFIDELIEIKGIDVV